jgi:hypothetical protein
MSGMGRLLAVANSLATVRHRGYLISDACQDFGEHGLHRPCPSSCQHSRVRYQGGPQFLALLPDLYTAPAFQCRVQSLVTTDNNKVKDVVTKLMSLSSGLFPIRFVCIG